MSQAVWNGDERDSGDELAGCLFRLLSQLVGPQGATAAPASARQEKLDLIRWLQAELATAERLLVSAQTGAPVQAPLQVQVRAPVQASVQASAASGAP